MNIQPHVVAILGPTASGKTNLALTLAQHFPCEIISLDSALVYQDMNIGTAKPSAKEQTHIPHHLIDIITPLQNYSAAQFMHDCHHLIHAIHARGHLPLIVGGTMMYFHALTQGLNPLPQANVDVRAQLQQQKNQYGLDHLYTQLQKHDPITANKIQANDSQRIERALEILLITGIPLSQHLAQQRLQQNPFHLHTIALIPQQRQILHHHIAQRFQHMINNGFIEEMQFLQQKYPQLHPDLPSMRCVGYRQAWSYLHQHHNINQFIEQSIAATRQLAKRQLTWLRKLQTNTIFDPHALSFDQLYRSTANIIKHTLI